MALGGNYGNIATTGISDFQAYIEIAIAEQTATQYRLQYKYSCWVGRGNFYGSYARSSWGAEFQLYGTGWYGDSGWIDGGWYSSGQTINLSCYVYYNASSGERRSTCNASYTVPQLQTVPNNVTNLKTTKNSDSQITVSWTNNPTSSGPYTGVYLDKETNDAEWSLLQDGNVSSYVDKDVTTNSRYRYRALAYNDVGNANGGNHLYSDYVYTTPSTPRIIAVQTNTTVSLNCDINGARYPSTYEWQYSTNNSSWSTISGTEINNTHTTSAATPYYRVRIKAPDGTASAWSASMQASKNAQIFVNIPSGQTMKAVYIWK